MILALITPEQVAAGYVAGAVVFIFFVAVLLIAAYQVNRHG